MKLAEVPVEEMVVVLVASGRGRKKNKQKNKICRVEREALAMAAPIASEELGSWGG